jgi:hypothetical protein
MCNQTAKYKMDALLDPNAEFHQVIEFLYDNLKNKLKYNLLIKKR